MEPLKLSEKLCQNVLPGRKPKASLRPGVWEARLQKTVLWDPEGPPKGASHCFTVLTSIPPQISTVGLKNSQAT